MISLELLTFGSLSKQWKSIGQEYEKRLRPFCRLKITELRAESFSSQTKKTALAVESKRLLKSLAKKDKQAIYLLSAEGKLFNSWQLANHLNSYQAKNICFVIGSALGFSQTLKEKYSLISLSPLTFPHEMVRIILLEQIYRSLTIINKKTYHY